MGYKLSHRLNCDQGGVRNARLTPDGNFVLTSGANKTVKLWSFKVKASYFAFLVLFHVQGLVFVSMYYLHQDLRIFLLN